MRSRAERHNPTGGAREAAVIGPDPGETHDSGRLWWKQRRIPVLAHDAVGPVCVGRQQQVTAVALAVRRQQKPERFLAGRTNPAGRPVDQPKILFGHVGAPDDRRPSAVSSHRDDVQRTLSRLFAERPVHRVVSNDSGVSQVYVHPFTRVAYCTGMRYRLRCVVPR